MSNPPTYNLPYPQYPHQVQNPQDPQNPSVPPQSSIPLQNLPRPPDPGQYGYQDASGAAGGRRTDDQIYPETIGPTVPAPAAQTGVNLPSLSTYWDSPYTHREEEATPHSPIDPLALQFALPPEINQRKTPTTSKPSATSYGPPSDYYEPPHHGHSDSIESDRAPLATNAQPISGSTNLATSRQHESRPRDSFQTVPDLDVSSPNQARPQRDTAMLGFDLEPGFSAQKYNTRDSMPDRRKSRSHSTAGALSRTASIVRAMSQRVVNISGEGELIDQHQARRQRSRSPSMERRSQQQQQQQQQQQHQQQQQQPQHISVPPIFDTSYPSQVYPTPAEEKQGGAETKFPQQPYYPDHDRPRPPMPNPLKGKSLGFFGPDNPIRLFLCDILVLPWTEPLILLLIVLQTVLLAIEAAPNVWEPEHQRQDIFGTNIDWAILGLFVVFTLELIARIIVSGFVLNAAEYSTIDRSRGVKTVVAERYRQIFQPQRQKSVRRSAPEHYGPSTFARSITIMQGQAVPETIEEQQRMQLARRAFLRHGFNRLDFVAVVSFWISFLLGMFGLEKQHHLFLFKMLSCLRILRLLNITRGNAIILRSLKKSAPLLVRVSFLMGFFWLLFAIIGVQSFKTSFSRQCVWIDPLQPTNLSATYKHDLGFCGGYLVNNTNPQPTAVPWVYMSDPGNLTTLEDGASSAKGFICPRGSICLQQTNPFNGTVHFDNILYSLELVFVIMSANTWSDLMYYTTNSDYLPTALFFGAGIIIMMLWMTNLLIAVITSSFQVIREESKASAFTADQDSSFVSLGQEVGGEPSQLSKNYNKTSWVWIVIIVFDLFAMSFRSARSTPERLNFINTTELVVTILLALEIVIRFVADWRGFFRGPQNIVDLLLAVATSVILVPPIHESGQTYNWLTAFQLLRAYRVVLAIPVTGKLIRLVLGNATGIGNLMVFVFLITFLMSIFAAQLFRGEVPPQDEGGEDRMFTFSTIYNSFLGMYQILSSEGWTSILYSVTGLTTEFSTAWIAGVFFIGWFILSYFILINMFIAVIQENFDISEDQKRLEQVKAFVQRKELGGYSSNLAFSKLFTFGRQRKKDPLDYGPATMEMLFKEAVVRDFLDDEVEPLQRTPTGIQSPPSHPGLSSGPIIETGILAVWWAKLVARLNGSDPNPFYTNVRFDGPNDAQDPRQMARQAVSATAARRKAQREYLARHPTYNTSLFIFKPKNPIRRLCQRVVGPGRGSERFDGVEPNKYAWYMFSAVMYASIVTMVVLACVTTPLYQKEFFNTNQFGLRNWFVWTDVAFAVTFTVEAIIKVIADGFFWTPNAYFRSSWGIIDGIVLITLWINVATLLANDGSISRAVGAFKALRALRLLNVSDSARNTFHSLIVVQGWKILSAALVSLSLLIPFAIYGVNLFNGKLIQCNDGIISGLLEDCVGEFASTPFSDNWPMLAPRVASNPDFSFDDFGSSLFILFQIVSQEGWADVSFAAQAITSVGLQPKFGNAQGNGMFFVIFNLLGTVFVLTLFISVFMRNYTEQTGVAFLTAEQRSWLELRKLLRQISPSKTSYDESKHKWKQWCHKRAIEKRGKWYLCITATLVLHLLLLLLEHAGEPLWLSNLRDFLFLVFTLMYIANIVIRIMGLGWTRFRRSSWDLYSLVVVTGALVSSILYLVKDDNEVLIQLHKSFLVGIVLLLIPRNDALDQLFKTAAASLTTIANLLATWFVFYIMFSIALTQSFGLTRFGKSGDNNQNFRTVPNALIMLFRFSAGEGWNSVMEDYAAIEPPMCVDSANFYDSDCGSRNWARVLFIMWNILSMYIFVNIFISLIYESFSYVYQRSSGLAAVDRDEIRRFKEAWRSVDPAGTGFISKEAFPRLLGELSGVFEMRIYDAEDSVRQILDDVRNDEHPAGRHASLATQSAYSGVDLRKLNDRLNRIDKVKVQERRRRFNLFFEEVMVSADPDKGISFNTVLMILAHYNIISDQKSLRLEEYLRRRARLTRVDDEVRRRIVLGFFDTLYWSRQFKRHMEKKRSARMTAVPQLDVPEILVDNDDDEQQPNTPHTARAPMPPFPGHQSMPASAFLSAEDARHQSWHHLSSDQGPHHQRTWSATSADVATFGPAQFGQNQHHPLGFPRAGGGGLDGAGGAAALTPTTPGGAAGGGSSHRQNASVFSFELMPADTLGGGSSQPGSGPNSRRTSAVSPAQVRELLDDSVWVESIRRSATVNRGQGWGGDNFGFGGGGGDGFGVTRGPGGGAMGGDYYHQGGYH